MIEVINADFLAWQPTRDFDFIFADPPFNIGEPYVGFDDDIEVDKYSEFTQAWTRKAWRMLADRPCVLCLHGPDSLAKAYLDFPQDRRIAWINWHYRFGQCNRGSWINSRTHCLVYATGATYTWQPDAVLVDSDRATVYADDRINETERGGRRVPFDVWGIPSDGPNWGRVQGNNGERCADRPNQLPEKYLERLILAYTNPDDWILDPFGGTGTTAVVAQALGRNCTTLDITAEACRVIEARLKRGAVRV